MSDKENSKVEIAKDKKEEKKVINKSKKKRKIAVLLMIVFFTLYTAISLRAEYLNYIGIGEKYSTVFFKKVENKYMVFSVVFVATYMFFFVLNKFIMRGLKKFFSDEKREMPKLPNKTLCILIALIVGMISSNMLADSLSIFNNAAVFGQTDPVFGSEIEYYMFYLPFIQTIIRFLIGVFAFSIIYIALYYVITLNTYFDGVDVEILKKNTFIKQEICMIILIVFLLCSYIFINAQNILTDNMLEIGDTNSTNLVGAGRVDLTIKLWGYRILSVIIALSIIRLLIYVKKSNFKQSVISVVIVPAYLCVMFIAMVCFQNFYVGKNELDSEKDYISYNIKNTKEAYGIDIDQKNIDNYSSITSDEISKNQDVIQNIPIVTKDVTQTTVKEHQENSVYYNYDNTFLALYNINGEKELIYITPREILTDNTISYNNKSLRYTHGYSAVVNSATEFDSNGYTKYILSDFKNQNILNITNPRIYFGLKTNSTIKVNSSFGKEYDYPITPTTYEENSYDGKAGLKLGLIDRIVLGLSEKNYRLAFSTDITENTRIINNRNIIERAKKIFPDVLYDEDPYLVITDAGKLVWVLDAYTRSSAYPYSQFTTIDIKGYREKINYIRNSVKVLIDAYDGTTTFYITDKTDPVIMTYRNMYPDLFTEEELPEDIKEHLVYPEFLYKIQANMINMYHDISEDTLYRADDIWQITTKTNSSVIAGAEMEPYYTVLKTVDSEEPKLGLCLTYNKYGKQNISSYLVGTVENGISKLSLYKFTSESNVVGITQLNNQIEQDEVISNELQAINTTGTKLIKDMIIVPINTSLLYVEPVYQVLLNESEIPVLKKVIVASGNTVAIGDNLNSALNNLFNDDYSVDLEIVNVEDINELIDSVIKANNNLKESLNANDFEMIGKDITRLQSFINQLESARKNEIEKQQENENNENTENIIDNSVSNLYNNEVSENSSSNENILNILDL